MKKVLEIFFVVLNFLVFLPTIFTAIFVYTSAEAIGGKEKDKALVASVYVLALLNCAAIWWLIYELISQFIR